MNNYKRSGFAACNRTNKPFDVDVVAEINNLIGDTKHQEFLAKLEKLDKPERDKLKTTKMLVIAPSGYMENGGKKESITEYIPNIFLDADGYTSKEEALRALQQGNELLGKHVLYSSLSVSCKGVHFIVVVNKLDNEADYFYSWDLLKDQVATIGMKLDDKTRNVAVKMALACHAEYTYLNPDAEPMIFPDKPETKSRVKNISTDVTNPDNDKEIIHEILAEVEKGKVTFIEGQRHGYIVKVAGKANTAGIERGVLITTLKEEIGLGNYPEHIAGINDTYDLYPNQFGKYPREPKSTSKKMSKVGGAMKYLDKQGHKFRYNEILGLPEFKKANQDEWLPLTDFTLNSFWKEIQQLGIKLHKNELYNLLNSDYAAKYDPFKQVIDNLPAWDHKDRIVPLAATINSEYPDQATVAMYLTKWLVALVACMYDMKPNHQVLTFVGGQGIGKTQWLLRLILQGLKNYFYSGPLNPQDKDSRIRVGECFLILLDELEVLGKYNFGVLKELITIEYINERRPYAARPERLNRRASFAATVNNPEFLKDQSGSRRFAVIEVKSLNYQHDIDMDMVYAQALYLYKSGFKYWFDQSEGEDLSETNNRFQVGELAEEAIPKCFRLPLEGEKSEKFSVTQIAGVLKKKGYYREVDSKLIQTVGNTLPKLGFKKNMSKGKSYYWLIEVVDEEESELFRTGTGTCITHIPDSPNNNSNDANNYDHIFEETVI